jgi:hypothetical protein
MNLTTTRRYRIALASLALTGLCCGTAGAATVRGAGTEGMDHWYGRAGGLAGSDSVSEAPAWQKPGQPLDVGLPANSGSLYFNEAQRGIRTKPNMRSYGENETGQSAASSQQEPASNHEH